MLKAFPLVSLQNWFSTSGQAKITGIQVLAQSSGMTLVEMGKRLLDASKLGDTDTVRTLMSSGAPFTTDWLGTSPLHFSAHYGHHQTAEVLLRSGISRDARTKVDRTPLHVAAQEGHASVVELLINNAADINSKDMLKMTPLHWATEKAHLDIIDLLVRSGADLTFEDKFDRTALDIALANGRTDIAQMLQLAQHTDIAITEGDTVTVETTDPIVMETVITADGAVKCELEGGDMELNSTSVLATLAALAEATGPIHSSQFPFRHGADGGSDAISWLDGRSIAVISGAEDVDLTSDDANLIASAVESDQTITLTEAGKLTLNYIRHGGLAGADGGLGTDDDDDLSTVVRPEDSESHMITLVADQDGTCLSADGQQVLVAVSEDGQEITLRGSLSDDEVVAGVMGRLTETFDDCGRLVIEEDDGTTITVTPADLDQVGTTADDDDLRHKLEAVRREAERYKEQLREKEEEAEKFRQRLSHMESVSGICDGVDLELAGPEVTVE